MCQLYSKKRYDEISLGIEKMALNVIIRLLTKNFFKIKLSLLPAIVQLVLDIYGDMSDVRDTTYPTSLIVINRVVCQYNLSYLYYCIQ